MTSSLSSKRIMITLSVLIAVIFFTSVVIFVKTFAQNVPVNDQALSSVPVAVEGAQGNFSLSTMLTRNNGNRLLWTNLITYALASLTQWNILLESWVSLIVAVLILVVLVKLASLDLGYALPLVIVLFAVLVFSLNQQFNWIWAPHNSSYFFVLFFLLAVLVIRQNEVGWRPLLTAAMLCFCSLFSLQQGIVSWPALMIVLLSCGYKNGHFMPSGLQRVCFPLFCSPRMCSWEPHFIRRSPFLQTSSSG